MKNEHFSSLLFSTQETTSNKSNFEQFPSSKIIFKKISFVRSFPLHQDEILIKPKNIKANISFNSRKELNLSVNKDDKSKFRENSKSIDRKNNLNNTLQEKLKNKVKGKVHYY